MLINMNIIFSSNRQYRASSVQKGAGMVEVLVALLILAVGLLGAVSLQSNGMSSNQRAVFSTEAELLAQDMAQRILAFGSSNSNGNAGANTGVYGGTNTNTGAYVDPGCGGGGCNANQTVILDQFEWQQLFTFQRGVNDISLPSAYGTVDWAADPLGGTYTITIYWDQDRTGAAGTDCTSNNKTLNLTCFIMEVSL